MAYERPDSFISFNIECPLCSGEGLLPYNDCSEKYTCSLCKGMGETVFVVHEETLITLISAQQNSPISRKALRELQQKFLFTPENIPIKGRG